VITSNVANRRAAEYSLDWETLHTSNRLLLLVVIILAVMGVL
jgi:hypothetical protein